MEIGKRRALAVVLVAVAGAAVIAVGGLFAWSRTCSQRAEPPAQTRGTLSTDLGTVAVLDDLGLRMGVADVRCENRTPVADVVLDRVPDGESRSFTVKVGDTVAFDQYELFVSQASCGWDGSGSASLVVLVKA